MPRTVVIGDGSAQSQVVALAVRPGDSVVVTHNAGSSLMNATGHLNTASVALGSGGSATYTTPTWLVSQGRSVFTISGGVYGP